MDRLASVIPCGTGHGAVWEVRGRAELDKLLADGAAYAVARGHGCQRDLDRCEDHGAADAAAPARVSSRAVDRGLHQVGSLRRLPVVDADRHLVGIISRADVLSVFDRSDADIREDIRTGVLRHELSVNPDTFEVTVKDGVVTLAGKPETSEGGQRYRTQGPARPGRGRDARPAQRPG